MILPQGEDIFKERQREYNTNYVLRIRYNDASMQTGVLFDMDGTLIDSHETHVECWLRYAAKEGVVLDRDRVNLTFGMVNREIIRSFWPTEVSDEKMIEIDLGKEAMVRDMFRANLPVMPGAVQLLQTLHELGFKLAVASSGPQANVVLACELLGITPLLDAIVTGSDVKRGKPHPEIFLTAANRISVEPQNCVVVEDATVGIQAAKAAGMKCIALLSTGHTESELKGADLIVRSLGEITGEITFALVRASQSGVPTSTAQ